MYYTKFAKYKLPTLQSRIEGGGNKQGVGKSLKANKQGVAISQGCVEDFHS